MTADPSAAGLDEADLVARAVDGDKAALEQVIRLLQDPVYRLALRMVWRPAEAEDATQEILIRVITRLASWRGQARLLTWAYRIGVNYLLNLRRQTPHEAQQLSLDEFRDTLADGLAAEDYRGSSACNATSGSRSCSATSSSSRRPTPPGYSTSPRPPTASG
jgi:RNA polymerase sigma factor (sigma-70 family)